MFASRRANVGRVAHSYTPSGIEAAETIGAWAT